MSVDSISIEIALAFPQEQHIVKITVPRGTKIKDAVAASDIFKKFHKVPDEVKMLSYGAGIFGKEIKELDTYELKAGDRIEIYRPLTIDPKNARIKRAEDNIPTKDKINNKQSEQ